MTLSNKISKGFQQNSLVNEPPKTMFGDGQNIKIQKVSPKQLEQ